MIEKFIVAIVCGLLFSWGGLNWHNARRFIMPVVLAVYLCWYLHSFIGALVLLSSPALCVGYGDKSILRKIFGDGWGRSVWGITVAMAMSVPFYLTGHIFPMLLMAYLAINFVLENALKNVFQVYGDLVIGFFLASVVFIVH